MTLSTLDHALAYAARGLRVVPIPTGQKYPAHKNWPEIATCDPERIRRWWSRHDDGIGIVTGAESGVFILDIDPRSGGDDSLAALEQRYGPLPDTAETITGSGGRHILFTWPAAGGIRNSASGVLGVGIDVRGEGGQFVAPPSIHANGQPYAWEITHDLLDDHPIADAPGWLLELLTTPPKPRSPRRDRGELVLDPTPGDVFEASVSWPELLEPDGWRIHSTHTDSAGNEYEMWTRPGKDVSEGPSATLYYGGSDVLKVFTSSVTFLRAEETYTRFGYLAARDHGGDHSAAARALRRTMNTAAAATPPTPPSDPGEKPVTPPPPERPAIVHNGRQLDDVAREATAALALANRPERLFVRAGEITRVRDDEERRPIVEQLTTKHLRGHLAEAATWWRSMKDGGMTATAPPVDVCDTILTAGAWPLPPLAGVVEMPVVRPDGTFATGHGYDPATKLYHWHRGDDYRPVPDAPSAAELAAAVEAISDILCDFPWDTSADRANAWGLLLTPLIRPLVGQVPMALIDAPEPGTGKGLLVTVAATLTLGRSAGLTTWPATEEEMAKVITSTLMGGSTMVIFDNVEGMIRSGNLAAALTADVWTGRILGVSKNATVSNRATWVATGNNIDVGGDLARRCYRIRLDARQAQPWKRTGFRHDPLAPYVAEHRVELLHALCVIVRSWWVAGRPQANGIPAMGGYTQWVRTVGGILDHAGIPGFLDNLAEFHATADREAQAWEAFLTAWHEGWGEQPLTVAELIAHMKDIYVGHKIRDYLPDDLAGHFESPSFSKRFSLALRKRCGRHYGDAGLHLLEMPRDRRNVAIYAVTTRSVRLFDDAGDDELPRASSQVTLDERGSAGVLDHLDNAKNSVDKGEFTYETSRTTPANPALPRADDTIDGEPIW